MTQNTQNLTLLSYAQEIGPKMRKLIELNDALKEWKAEDEQVQEYMREIKDVQEALKGHIEDKESNLLREISDLNVDIKLAVKAAAKGTQYKPAELKAYFAARAKESVGKVVEKGELFQQLDSELA